LEDRLHLYNNKKGNETYNLSEQFAKFLATDALGIKSVNQASVVVKHFCKIHYLKTRKDIIENKMNNFTFVYTTFE